MRTLSEGVVVSGFVHAAVFVWFGTREPDTDEPVAIRDDVPIEIVAAPPPRHTDEPVDVALLDGGGSAAPGAAATDRAVVRGSAAIASGGHASGETAPGRTSPLMKMRGNGVDLAHLKWTPSFDPDAVPLPPPVKISGELHDSGGGTHRSDQGAFDLEVDRDGTAHIHDKPSVDVHLAIPRPKDVGGAVAEWYEAPKGVYGETPEAPAAKHAQVFDNGDGTKGVIVPVLGGAFNIDDFLMRRSGVDPYASRKLHVLDATRDERAELGSRRRKEQLSHATQLMQANLDRLWATVRDGAARKQALFDLWDECAETGDTKLVEAGGDARRLIVGFIRARLPAGSADAYTAAELASLNKKKQSKAAFQPYD